jgi:glycosyltransferase involved in cell wall biosynthesis
MTQSRAMRPDGPVTVCFPFMGDKVGGSHISAFKLIEALDRTRFEPLVLVHEPLGKIDQLLSDFGIAREPTPLASSRPHGMMRELFHARAASEFLKRKRVRIVHTNDGDSHLVWAVPTRLAGAKHVWHHRANPNARGLRFLAPWAADRVIAVSRFASPKAGLWSAAGKCTVVHSPFDTDCAHIDRTASRAAAIAELGCRPETKLVAYFGNLVPRKKPLAFVEAIAALRKVAPNLPLLGLFFGGAKFDLDKQAMQLAEKLGVADCVRLMGFRYPPEPWLAACDVVLAPGVEEPFGRSLIEAMLIGTPVVATASGGNFEAIEDGRTGFLVPVGAPEMMAARMRDLLINPALSGAMADAARADAMSRFGVERHVIAVMDIYDQLLAKAGSHEVAATARATAVAHD